MKKVNNNKIKAFTLIEVLVVMFIIAITLGVVGISVKSMQLRNDLQPFVDRVYQKLTLFGQEAVLRQTEIGCSFYKNKIEILHYKQNNKEAAWKVYETIKIPTNVFLSLKITEEEIFRKTVTTLDTEDAIDLYNNNNSPEIIFSSAGQLMPFKLIISHPDEITSYEITGRFSGELSILTFKDNDKNNEQ